MKIPIIEECEYGAYRITGYDVTITFKRAGKRIQLRRIKKSRLPLNQRISKEEIIKFMEDNFQVRFV